MGNDRHDLADVRIRPAHRADAEAIMLAHLDSIRSIGPTFYPPKLDCGGVPVLGWAGSRNIR
jgi:hypothetical protein